MKKVFYFVYLIVLICGIIGVSTAKAQIVLAGDSICTANAYVLSTAFNNVSCVGQATGVATVAARVVYVCLVVVLLLGIMAK
jgi:hypothetical protein